MRALPRFLGVRLCGGWLGWLTFAAVFAVAAAVVATGPVFVAAVGDDVAEDAVRRATALERSVQIQADALIEAEGGLALADAAVARQFAAIEGLAVGTTTISVGGTRTSAAAGGPTLNGTVRIVSRDGALEALEPIAGGGEDGVWVSERVAGILELQPGDVVSVGDPSLQVELPVAAVYRDLDLSDLGPYWSLVPLELLPRELRVFGDVVQPELFVMAEDALTTSMDSFLAETGLPVVGRVWWQAHAAPEVDGGEALSRLAAGIAGLERDANDATTALGGALRAAGIGPVRTTTSLVDINAEVAVAVDRIEPAIAPVRLAGTLLGLGVVGLGAWFVARRRAVELRTWVIAGRSGTVLGAHAAVGTVAPAVAGGIAGAAAAPLLVRSLGPSAVVHTDAVPLATVGVVVAGGLLIVALVTAATAPQLLTGAQATGLARRAAEAALYLLAIVLMAQLARRDPARAEPGGLDLATVLAPVVGAAALAALGGRGIAAAVRRLRRRGAALPTGLFLAWRRVAAAAAGRLGIVLPIAAAAGVAVFSSLLVAAVDDGLEAKATVAVGSDVAAGLARVGVPETLPEGMTLIWTGSATRTADSRVMLMVLDDESYGTAARWDSSFGIELPELEALLAAPDDRVPAALTGRRAETIPPEGAVRIQGVDLAYRRVAELEAVPAMSEFLPTMVVSQQALWEWAVAHPEVSGFRRTVTEPVDPSVAPEVSGVEAARVPFTTEGVRELLLGLGPRLLARTTVNEVETFLSRSGQPTDRIETRADVLGNADLTAQRWAFDYLRVLALVAIGMSLAVLGFGMIEDQRRNVIADALARRMGRGRAAAGAALAAETAALVTTALALGLGGGWLLAAAFSGRFDPLPAFPPGLRHAAPAAAFGVVAAVVAAGAIVVWWMAQRAAARANVAEVLRD